MKNTMIDFPVPHRLEDMNKLAVLLNTSALSGEWHFAAGSRFDQLRVNVEFDTPADGERAWLQFNRSSSGDFIGPSGPIAAPAGLTERMTYGPPLADGFAFKVI